jgi:DNA-binding NarL/FixJ family response regulator
MPLLDPQIPEKFISISMIEDNRFMRVGWRTLLENVKDFIVLGEYENCEEAFQTDEIGNSDVVLMDIGLPGMSGIEGVNYLTNTYPGISIIMCTVFDDNQNVFDALCAGAIGYLLKKTTPDELIKAIREAAAGGSPMTPNIARKVIASFQKSPSSTMEEELYRLTPREQEVLEKLAEGKSYAAIAKEFKISINGVRFHIRSIYEKLHVHSRSEAIAKGLKKRIIQPPR